MFRELKEIEKRGVRGTSGRGQVVQVVQVTYGRDHFNVLLAAMKFRIFKEKEL